MFFQVFLHYTEYMNADKEILATKWFKGFDDSFSNACKQKIQLDQMTFHLQSELCCRLC